MARNNFGGLRLPMVPVDNGLLNPTSHPLTHKQTQLEPSAHLQAHSHPLTKNVRHRNRSQHSLRSTTRRDANYGRFAAHCNLLFPRCDVRTRLVY